MNFELACLEDFNEIENLYWDLIDKSKEEPSFPDWEKGVHPSADFLMAGIVQKELFVLRDEGIIKACAIVNSNSNKEYKRVAWKVNERDNNKIRERSQRFKDRIFKSEYRNIEPQ